MVYTLCTLDFEANFPINAIETSFQIRDMDFDIPGKVCVLTRCLKGKILVLSFVVPINIVIYHRCF